MSDDTAWAETVLRVLDTPYPYASGHVAGGPDDTDVEPRRLHPAFHGSLDWHSAVHMLWSALRLRPRVAEPLADRLTATLTERLTETALAVEVAYLRGRPGFERPYGWAWALMLADEAERSGPPGTAAALTPLADLIATRFADWLPRLAYPVRHGVHANTAFALGLAWDARPDLRPLITDRAVGWFGTDTAAPVAFEPSGEDFLSPTLTEADLMRRVWPADRFATWLADFLPDLGPLLDRPVVLDSTDGKAVHLYGLGLSRAGQLRRLADHLPPDRREEVRVLAQRQYDGAASQIDDGDFVSTHWLVSFALLAEVC